MLSLASPEDVVNDALVRIGWKFRIGSLYDGTLAAKTALQIYSQTRDALLRSATWGFAEVIVPGVALPGATPPIPWTNVFEYPDNCLRLRDIYSASYLRNNPTPNLWTLLNPGDGTGISIACYLNDPLLVYTRQVHDPRLWESMFTELLCARLGRLMAPALASIDQTKVGAEDEKMGEEAAVNVPTG